MDRRKFLHVSAGTALAAPLLFGTASAASSHTQDQPLDTKVDTNMNIVIAADPFAVTLKDALVARLKEKGHTVTDVGSTTEKKVAYYDCCPVACKIIQEKKADRAVLLCGTGMGMSVIANRFKGVTAAVVESVFAAKMSRAINNANALCLGAMIWGDWMAGEAVDVFLATKFTEGLDPLTEFLKDAEKKVDAIRP